MKAVVVDRLLQELGLNESERGTIEKNVLIKDVTQGTILIQQGVLEVCCFYYRQRCHLNKVLQLLFVRA